MSWRSGFTVPSLGETTRKLAGLGQRVNRWRGKRRSSPLWTVAVAAIMLVMALPIVTVVVLALTPEENIWPHLVANVLFGPPLRSPCSWRGSAVLVWRFMRGGQRHWRQRRLATFRLSRWCWLWDLFPDQSAKPSC